MEFIEFLKNPLKFTKLGARIPKVERSASDTYLYKEITQFFLGCIIGWTPWNRKDPTGEGSSRRSKLSVLSYCWF